jgi:hypothetical protein
MGRQQEPQFDSRAREPRRLLDELRVREGQRRAARGQRETGPATPITPSMPIPFLGTLDDAIIVITIVDTDGTTREFQSVATIRRVGVGTEEVARALDEWREVVLDEWGQVWRYAPVLSSPSDPFPPLPVPAFDYYGHDPNQIGHGNDGGVPMTLAELLGADEKMDEIDRVLDK